MRLTQRHSLGGVELAALMETPGDAPARVPQHQEEISARVPSQRPPQHGGLLVRTTWRWGPWRRHWAATIGTTSLPNPRHAPLVTSRVTIAG